ncbi:hypothetical protein H206_03115 [Candidatus Electrothrix aarhusensis]|uniref:Uncharacterized protein n=1 Tax=Candidatus Electrothrix aarhusensis TaxID=1859131 RepID=A0A3S3QKJ3_9BACT|nr:hypothetical protein H206_03115 [Candidatus Electrothrix aarhusensis]
MKFKLLLLSLALACSGSFAINGALAINGTIAQGCRAELINGPGGVIVDIFNGSNCGAVSNSCNNKLRQLRYQAPYFYRDAYCNVANTLHHVYPPLRPALQPTPRPYVTRTYDRCQSPGIVRCTQEWSNGRVFIEDFSCPGCRGYGRPAGDPCGWRCSFPQQ